MTEYPFVTVMMPVRNEEKHIQQTLTQLSQQSYPPDRFEIIVVDGMSTDHTVGIVKEFERNNPSLQIRLFENEKRLSSAARNIAVDNARGEWVLLIDGHVWIENDFLLKNSVELATQNQVKILGRPQPLCPPDISLFQQAVATARTSKLAHSSESKIYSGFEGITTPLSIGVMYHKSVFEEIGRFDESFDAAEDLEFNYRAEAKGFVCYTSPKLAVYYYPRENFPALFKQLSRYGRGRANFSLKHPSRTTVNTLVPPAFVLLLAVLVCLSIISELARYGLLAILVLYYTVLLSEGLKLGNTLRQKVFLIPTIIATIHFGIGVGFIKGIFSFARKNFGGTRRVAA